MAHKITKAQFQAEVLDSEIPVLVDFFATWCSPCKMLSPVIDRISDAYEGRAKVFKVDTDQEGALAMDYGVMSIPTLIFFKNGQAVERVVGLRSQDDIAKILDRLIG